MSSKVIKISGSTQITNNILTSNIEDSVLFLNSSAPYSLDLTTYDVELTIVGTAVTVTFPDILPSDTGTAFLANISAGDYVQFSGFSTYPVYNTYTFRVDSLGNNGTDIYFESIILYMGGPIGNETVESGATITNVTDYTSYTLWTDYNYIKTLNSKINDNSFLNSDDVTDSPNNSSDMVYSAYHSGNEFNSLYNFIIANQEEINNNNKFNIYIEDTKFSNQFKLVHYLDEPLANRLYKYDRPRYLLPNQQYLIDNTCIPTKEEVWMYINSNQSPSFYHYFDLTNQDTTISQFPYGLLYYPYDSSASLTYGDYHGSAYFYDQGNSYYKIPRFQQNYIFDHILLGSSNNRGMTIDYSNDNENFELNENDSTDVLTHKYSLVNQYEYAGFISNNIICNTINNDNEFIYINTSGNYSFEYDFMVQFYKTDYAATTYSAVGIKYKQALAVGFIIIQIFINPSSPYYKTYRVYEPVVYDKTGIFTDVNTIEIDEEEYTYKFDRLRGIKHFTIPEITSDYKYGIIPLYGNICMNNKGAGSVNNFYEYQLTEEHMGINTKGHIKISKLT